MHLQLNRDKLNGFLVGRNLRYIIERIEQIGASFRSLTEAIDATTPAGRWLCTWSGAVRSLRGLGSASGRRPASRRHGPRGASGDGGRNAVRHSKRTW